MLPALLALIVAAGSWTYIPDGSKWTPSNAQLSGARAGLRDAVEREGLAKKEQLPSWESYAFQYQGREIDGRKVIYVNGFCDIPDYAATSMVFVFDGGACYFFAIYDVQTKAYAGVVFNGHA